MEMELRQNTPELTMRRQAETNVAKGIHSIVIPVCAPIAQLVEHLICNQEVGSSSLSGGTKTLLKINDVSANFVLETMCHVPCAWMAKLSANNPIQPAVVI